MHHYINMCKWPDSLHRQLCQWLLSVCFWGNAGTYRMHILLHKSDDVTTTLGSRIRDVTHDLKSAVCCSALHWDWKWRGIWFCSRKLQKKNHIVFYVLSFDNQFTWFYVGIKEVLCTSSQFLHITARMILLPMTFTWKLLLKADYFPKIWYFKTFSGTAKERSKCNIPP